MAFSESASMIALYIGLCQVVSTDSVIGSSYWYFTIVTWRTSPAKLLAV